MLKPLGLRFEQHRDEVIVGDALLTGHRPRVNIERSPAICMAQQRLSHFHVHTHRPQVCGETMAEGVPADLLADYAGALQCGPDAPLQKTVRAERFRPVQPERRKQEVSVCFIDRLPTPFQKCGEHQWMEGNRAP